MKGGEFANIQKISYISTMADNVTNELILEHLKEIDAKLEEQDAQFDRIESDLQEIRSHLAVFVTSKA